MLLKMSRFWAQPFYFGTLVWILRGRLDRVVLDKRQVSNATHWMPPRPESREIISRSLYYTYTLSDARRVVLVSFCFCDLTLNSFKNNTVALYKYDKYGNEWTTRLQLLTTDRCNNTKHSLRLIKKAFHLDSVHKIQIFFVIKHLICSIS